MVIDISVLIDTSVLIAFANEADQNHAVGKKIIDDILDGKYGSPVISDYIFDETITVCLARTKSHEKTKSLGEYLLNSEIIMVGINDVLFNETWKLFCKSPKLSFTDTSSIAVTQILGVMYMATLDKNLAKASGVKSVDN